MDGWVVGTVGLFFHLGFEICENGGFLCCDSLQARIKDTCSKAFMTRTRCEICSKLTIKIPSR